MLRVLSCIITHEHNYVLNTRHYGFPHLRIAGRQEFAFDPHIRAPESG